MSFFNLLVSLLLVVANAQNIAITSEPQVAVAALAQNGITTILSQKLAPDTVTWTDNRTDDFTDVTIDLMNNNFFFSLSQASLEICSYMLDVNAATFSLIGCVTLSEIGLLPFTGMSAFNGTLIVSVGVRGVTVFDYDTATGEISSTARFINERLSFDAESHPDVVLLSRDVAALSTEFDSSPNFGTVIADVSNRDSRPRMIRKFRIQSSIANILSLTPTNYALVNALYQAADGIAYMYTASGDVFIQKPLEDNNIPIGVSLGGFTIVATTCTINQAQGWLVLGGRPNTSSTDVGVVAVFDVALDLMVPAFITSRQVIGAITSVVSSGDIVAYTTRAANAGVEFFEIIDNSTMAPSQAPTMSPTNGMSSASRIPLSKILFATVVLISLCI